MGNTGSGKLNWSEQQTMAHFNVRIAEAMERAAGSQMSDNRSQRHPQMLTPGTSVYQLPPETTVPESVWNLLKDGVLTIAKALEVTVTLTERYINSPNSIRLIFERAKTNSAQNGT